MDRLSDFVSSCIIFDFTARKFLRRVFIDHMLYYLGSTQPLFIATNSKKCVLNVRHLGLRDMLFVCCCFFGILTF